MASVAASAENAIDRDRLMKDVLAETLKEDRGRLMNICVDSHPENVAFIDWVIVVSILSKVGIVDLHDDDFDYNDLLDHRDWYYEVDDDGRIIQLGIHGDVEDPFDLPAGIARLERLTNITLHDVRSLPAKEVSNLLYLQTLRLNACSDLLENFPAHMELKYLKELRVSAFRFEPSSPFLTWMTGQLQSLECLVFSGMKKNETKCILDALLCTTPDVCFQNSLRYLSIHNCKVDENQFGTFLFEILPRFSKLSHLEFRCNEIQSVHTIVDRINTDDTCFVSKSISHLNLCYNPVIEKLKVNPKEKAAICSLLQTYNTICNIGYVGSEEHEFSDVEYALRINHAGRSLVEDGGNTDTTALPLSVWPIVLERAYEKSCDIGSHWDSVHKKNATGLFYLLRNGPVLAGRTALTGTAGLPSCNGGDANENPSKKQKLAVASSTSTV